MVSVIVSSAGTSGPRGNSILSGSGTPSSGTGIDGDWYIDNSNPAALTIYGPKAAGAWGAGQGLGAGGALLRNNNLSDLNSAPTARINLGLGGAAVLNVGTVTSTVAAGDDSRLTNSRTPTAHATSHGSGGTDPVTPAAIGAYTAAAGSTLEGRVTSVENAALTKADNLSSLASPATARTNLGLGGAATLPVGTSASTVAAGDDSRITGSAQKAQNLADLQNPATARTNLGLGSSATRNRPAWVFDISEYGALGNGMTVADGAMTASSAVLTCATSTPFVVGDVGRNVMVLGAGASGETLVGTISGYTDSSHVTLSATAGTTVSGACAMWSSDDTAAIQAAIDAAGAYAAAHSGAATVLFPPAPGRYYGIAGTLKTGGSTLGNAQLALPVYPATGRKITLTIQGTSSGAGVQHWQQTLPNTTGSTLLSYGLFANSGAQIASINAAGNPCVLGGPSQPGGYGVAPGNFSNMYLDVDNVSILTAHSKFGFTYSALDLSGIANARLKDVAYSTAGTVPGGSYVSPGVFATGLSIGVLLPANGNNDLTMVNNVTCGGGYTYAILVPEHSDIVGLRLLYCWAALCPVGSYYSSVGAAHSIRASLISIEQCTFLVYIFGPGTGGLGPTMDLRIDTETSTPRFGCRTSGTGLAAARGKVAIAGLFTAANLTLDYPTGLQIENAQLTYPIATKTANYTVTSFDEDVVVDATSGAITITLPTAVGRTRPVTVKKIDSTVNAVTIDAAGSETIDGQLIRQLPNQWDHVTLVPSGSSWYVKATTAPTVWRRRTLPDPVVADSLYAGAAPSISTAMTSTPTATYIKYAPIGAALSGSDVTGPFTYLGAGAFQLGSGTPDSSYLLPTSRYPNTRGTLTSSQAVWSLEFGTDAQIFQLRFNFQTAGMSRLLIDGRKVADLMTAVGGTTAGNTHLMTVDLGSAAPRVIRFDFYTVPFGGVYLPPGATMWSTVSRTDRTMVLGDSISDGSAINAGGGHGTWFHRAARFLGSSDYWDEGRGGTGYISPGTSPVYATFGDRVAADVIAWAPNRLFVWGGYNDNAGSQPSIAAAAASLYAAIRAGLPSCDVYVLGCWSPTGSPGASLTNTDATLRAAAAGAGYPFISPITGAIYNAAGTLVATHGGWITGTGRVGATTGSGNADIYVGSDAVHPTDAGHVYLARRITAAVRELMPA